jgi:HEXXH motif-containing protein
VPAEGYFGRCQQFSHPGMAFSDELFAAIIQTHGARLAAIFVERHRLAISCRSDGLVELLGSNGKWPMRGVWDVSFGGAQQDAAGASAVSTAAQMALSLAAAGVRGSWSARFAEPAHLRFSRFSLPPLLKIFINADRDQLRMEGQLPGGVRRSWVFEICQDGWRADRLVPSPSIGNNANIRLLLASDFPDCPIGDSAAAGLPPVVSFTPEMREPFEAGLAFLTEVTPHCKRWVERVLTGILLYQHHETKSGSGSRGDMPGVIACSLSSDTKELAEVMVHESCHQYFYVASRVGAVDDGGDKALYYSPPVKRERPIDRILIAYHAFANVLLWYADVMQAGADDHGILARRASVLRPQVEVLEQALESNRHLTEVGVALFHPLKLRLHEAYA